MDTPQQPPPQAEPAGLRLMPRDTDAERAVLACMMQFPDQTIPRASAELTEDHFFLNAHKILFRHMVLLFGQGGLDIFLLNSSLAETQEMDAAGGPAAVSNVLTDCPTAALYDGYAGFLEEARRLRRLIDGLTKIAASAFGREASSKVLAAEAEKLALEITDGKNTRIDTSWHQTLGKFLKDYDAAKARQGSLPGFQTGLPLLDYLTNGFVPGEMWVVAGLSGSGKSALVLNFMRSLAVQQIHSGLISLEMTRSRMAMRILANDLNIDSKRFLRGDPACEKSLEKEFHRYGAWKLEINDEPSLTLADVDAQIRRWAKAGVQFVAIDYLSLINTEDLEDRYGGEGHAVIAKTISALRVMAKRHQVCLVVLAQFNRGFNKTIDRRPVPSDLRGSSQIENDAHVIALLHQEDWEATTADVETDLIVAKCREGSEGVVQLLFEKPFLRFSPRKRGEQADDSE